VIYIISDGEDNESTNKPATVERRLLASGVRLFVFLLVPAGVRRVEPQFERNGLDPSREMGVRVRPEPYRYGPDALRDTAEHSGGMVSSFAGDLWWQRLSKQELATILTAARLMYPVMERSYRLEIRIPPGADKPRDWSLAVMEGKKKKSLLQVLYPRLSPCPAQNP